MKSFKNDFPAIHNPQYYAEFTSKWSVIGAGLSTDQVAKLERNVEANAWDLKARALLTSYYYRKKHSNQQLHQAWFDHLCWLVSHRPDHNLAIHFNDFYGQRNGYLEVKSRWLKQLELHPNNATIHSHAAYFLSYCDDRELAEQVISSALKIHTSNVELRDEQVRLYSRWPGKEVEALHAFDQLRDCFPSSDTFYQLEKLPAIAFAAGNDFRAIEAANELLEIVERKPKYRSIEPIRNEVHTVLGKIALKNGDVEKARWHLHESLPIATSELFLPSLQLARCLVTAGESVSVLEYLDKYAKTCPPFLEDAFKIRFQIEHGQSYDDINESPFQSLPKYKKALLDYRFTLLMNLEAPQRTTSLKRELERARSSVSHWNEQINGTYYTEICANLCLEIHQQHLARLEALTSSQD